MASPLISRVPQCFNCIRRTAGSLGERHLFPAGQQIRGKKSVRRTKKKVNALLLEDIKGYGKMGNVLSVSPGVMRNIWFPSQQAEYATEARMAELGLKKEDIVDLDAVRHAEVVVPKKAAVEKAEILAEKKVNDTAPTSIFESAPFVSKPKEAKPVKAAEPARQTPEESTAILSRFLPASIDFYRTTITPVKAAPKVSSSVAAKAVVSTLRGKKAEPTSIEGSVSTSDIAVNFMAILAQEKEGEQIKLWPEDIVFVKETESKAIEHLGSFEVDIKVKGASKATRRTINVKAQA